MSTNTEKQQKHYTGPFASMARYKSLEEEVAWAATQKKTCNKCHEELCLNEFGFNTSSSCPFGADGTRLRRGDCKTCNKEAGRGKNEAVKIAKAAGIPFKAPEGTCCEICGSTEKIVFDHDHDTNQFRGWLCDPCNRSLGVLGDNVQNVLVAFNYLIRKEKAKLVVDPTTGELRKI